MRKVSTATPPVSYSSPPPRLLRPIIMWECGGCFFKHFETWWAPSEIWTGSDWNKFKQEIYRNLPLLVVGGVVGVADRPEDQFNLLCCKCIFDYVLLSRLFSVVGPFVAICLHSLSAKCTVFRGPVLCGMKPCAWCSPVKKSKSSTKITGMKRGIKCHLFNLRTVPE